MKKRELSDDLVQLDGDLKELFMDQKLEELNERVAKEKEADIRELSLYNWEIVKKYYDDDRMDIILQFLKFVSYSCFLVEYANQQGIISAMEYQNMFEVYQNVFDFIQKNK